MNDAKRVLGIERLENRSLLTTVTFTPIADTTLFEDANGALANGIGDGLFAGATANSNSRLLRRALIKFDVASVIPVGATINSVDLRLTMNRTPNPVISVPMTLNEVSADWGEGTTKASGQGGAGGDSTPNSATWKHRFFSGTNWTNLGGDFDSAASATTAVAGLGNYVWTGSGLVADVQKWVNTPSSQFGWLLRAATETTAKNAKRFASREHTDSNVRPLLTVDYTVVSSNKAPTLDAISNPAAILEDASNQSVGLSGISAGQGETQTLTITAASSNTALVPNPTITYTSPNATGTLAYSPVANQSGTATITVTVKDSGGTANGGVDTVTRNFTVTVNPVNDAPTMDAIANPSILEDAIAQTINLSGISSGPLETQGLTITAASSNTALIPNPTITYSSPNTTGTLAYAPAANQSGTSTITVTVKDDGGTANGGADTFTRTFTVTVNPVNDAPTLDPIANPAAILEDASAQTINLSGISAGPLETQVLTVNAVSNNPGLIPNPTVTYASPNSTGTLEFAPVANQFGTATITVVVTDNGSTADGGVNSVSRTFIVTVNAVNDAPTLDAIANPPVILEDAAAQSVNLAGITSGPNETQSLTVTATSSNPGLIPNPTVTYASANSTGTLAFTPVANQSGNATITVTVSDNGGTANSGVDTFSRTFTVAVTPVNDAPNLDPIANPTAILEDAGSQKIDLTGISAGPNETQSLTITAVSGNPGLIPHPTVTYTSPNATGSLAYSPLGNQSGTTTITVIVNDNGGTTSGGVESFSRVFTVTVIPVNDAPTLDSIANPAAILEDAGAQSINLSGISAGPLESQTLTVTAVSSNPGLIANPIVGYTSANATGTLEYAPVSNQSGTATITVTVSDNGGTGNGGIDAISRTITVTVNPVNDAPTLDSIGNPAAILEDAGVQSINLSGISAGPLETQALTISAVSNNPGLIPNPIVSYTSPSATGSLTFAPVADESGTAVVTVTVQDNGGLANGGVDTLTRTFTVTVSAVNDAPKLDAILDPAPISEDAAAQTVNLAGIAAGTKESQPLSVTAVSDNPSLIPTLTVNYSSPNATGTLAYTPLPDISGKATITVTVEDGGLDGNLGTKADNATTNRQFTVTVNPVNDLPTLDALSDLQIPVSASEQTLNLTGISAGGGETQPLRLTAVSSNTTVLSTPTVIYTSANPTGALKFTPVPLEVGASTVTVTVEDGGLDGNLATIEDNSKFSRSFSVQVGIANAKPTLNPIPDKIISEDAAEQVVNLDGISAGSGETQNLRITTTNSNSNLIANPAVTYTSPQSTGVLRFTPISNQFGSTIISVVAEDDGPDANFATASDNSKIERTFTVTVTPVNDAPTLDSIANPPSLPVNAGAQTLNLAGITAGPNETQTLTVAAVSSNPGLVPDPQVNYTSANVTGTLTYTPARDQIGTATITVTVTDDGGTADGGVNSTTRTFTITVFPVNQPPTLDAIPNLAAISEDAATQAINLTGITAGSNESQPLSVTATSDNPSVIPIPAVNYTSPGATGSLTFTPVTDQSGKAAITVTVEDGGLDGILATKADNLTTSQQFTVTVNAVNDSPTLDSLPDRQIARNASEQVVNLTGISAGGGETQPLRIAAVSSNESIVPVPAVTYTSPGATGNLKFNPVPNVNGSTTITVTVEDGGLDADLSTAQDNARFSRSFAVQVGVANAQPTLNAISDKVIDEDAIEQVINLEGISAGTGENQNLRITATSSKSSLVANPAITYTSPQSIGALKFKPLGNQNGTATITVSIEDDGPDANFATTGDNAKFERTFTVTVNAVNDAPLAVGDSFGVNQEVLTILDLLSNDSDVDSALNATSVQFKDGPTSGTVAVNASGKVEYQAKQNFFGQDIFSYRVADTQGAFSDWVNVSLAINARPTAKDDLKYVNSKSPTNVDVFANDSDPDGPKQDLQFILVTNLDPGVGRVEVTPEKLLRFTPGQSFAGSVQLRYRLRDALGAESAEAVASLGIFNQNPNLPEDVNASGLITPLDVLLIINTLNVEGGRQILPGIAQAPFYDVSADGFVTPLDALIIINYLNSRLSGEGEIEPSGAAVPQFANLHSLGNRNHFDDSDFQHPVFFEDVNAAGLSSSKPTSLSTLAARSVDPRSNLDTQSAYENLTCEATDELFARPDEWLSNCLDDRNNPTWLG